MEGTKDKPFVVYVNTKYPERHRDRFLIMKMEKQSLEGMDEFRTVWHIELPCPCLEDLVEYYEASSPLEPYKTCDGVVHANQVLVRTPSLSGWQRDGDTFNVASREQCVTTKKQRDALLTEIDDKESERFWLYYLLVFPPDANLDNSVLGDRRLLWSTIVGQRNVEEKPGDSQNRQKEELHSDGETVLWKIAERDYSKTKSKSKTTNKWGINFVSKT
jgi:hypothetical protein